MGIASLAASGVFFGLRQGAINELKDACGDELQCTESERSIYDRGRTFTTVANVTLGVGALGVVAGTIWLVASGSGKNKEKPRASLAPAGAWHLFVHPSGAGVVGQF